MSFRWVNEGLEHTDNAGVVTVIAFDQVPTYMDSLHASEKQTPVPPIPADVSAAAAASPEIQAAAQLKPDAVTAAIADSLAKALAAQDVARSSAAEAEKAAGRAQDAASMCDKVVSDLQAIATGLSKAAT